MAWGNNNEGALGDGTNTSKNTPVRVGDDTDWTAIDAGHVYSLGLKSDGTLWAWGYNAFGQLGDGTNDDRNTPVQIGDDTDWTAIDTEGYHSLGLKSDGTLWAWGLNDPHGQLGDGTNDDKNTPVQVGDDTDWTAIEADYRHSLALKSDGTLWAWGNNDFGALGDGTNTSRNTPVQVGDDTDWTAIDAGFGHSLGVKTDGTLWAWGLNTTGQLGDGTLTNKNVPTQVGDDTDWTAIDAGGHLNLALKSDGTLWAWGRNGDGQLGDGTNTNKNVPVRVGDDTDWTAIDAGFEHSLGVKTDGTLWAWGLNDYGQLGDGTNTNKNVPVAVSGLTGVIAIAASSYHSVALVNEQPPVANADFYVVDEDQPLTVPVEEGVLDNDTDDADTLKAARGRGPSHGSLTLNENGSFIYTPEADFFGEDSFTYKAIDDNGDEDEATVTITVNSVNDPPSFTLGQNQSVNEDAGPQTVTNFATNISPGPPDESGQGVVFDLTNDNDALFSVQPSISSDGTLTYTPAPNAHGSATVTVVAKDNGGTANGGDDESEKTFTITVSAVNDQPLATDDTYTKEKGKKRLSVPAPGVLLDDSDPEGDSLTVRLLSAPQSGKVELNSDGSFVYYYKKPHKKFNGASFVYEVSDGQGGVDTATVTINKERNRSPKESLP